MGNAETCQFEMSAEQLCGRAVSATGRVRTRGRCVLHTDDPDKPLRQFQEALASIQPDAMGVLDFTGIVFPRRGDSGFADRQFEGEADFSGAKFTGTANFSHAQFPEYANFSQCVFQGSALFSEAVFEENANFHTAHFQDISYFLRSRFEGTANFMEVRANGNLHFKSAEFLGPVEFSDGDFNGLFFDESRFLGSGNEVNLSAKSFQTSPLQIRGAHVEGRFILDEAELSDVDFSGTRFLGGAFIRKSVFKTSVRMLSTELVGPADFRFCRFKGPVIAAGARFSAGARFFGATFESDLRLDGAVFGGEAELDAIADFRQVRFAAPSKVRFLRINEDEPEGVRLRLHETYVKEVQFEGVNWYRSQRTWYRPGRLTLQDELDVRSAAQGGARQPGLTPEAASTVYHRLLNNFELVRSFGPAEDCFCGAMDLRLLDKDKPWPERLFIRLYRAASYYGSSYLQAFVVLVILVVAFGLIFSLTGLSPTTAETQLAPASNAIVAAVANGLFHSFQVAAFQEPVFQPEGTAVRLLEGLMRILTTSQVALFLLALRRRFRR